MYFSTLGEIVEEYPSIAFHAGYFANVWVTTWDSNSPQAV